jgi:hypothetical protein
LPLLGRGSGGGSCYTLTQGVDQRLHAPVVLGDVGRELVPLRQDHADALDPDVENLERVAEVADLEVDAQRFGAAGRDDLRHDDAVAAARRIGDLFDDEGLAGVAAELLGVERDDVFLEHVDELDDRLFRRAAAILAQYELSDRIHVEPFAQQLAELALASRRGYGRIGQLRDGLVSEPRHERAGPVVRGAGGK